MAGALSSILTAYRAALTTAGFTNLPERLDMADLPRTKLNKIFSLIVAQHAPKTSGGAFGGGHVDYSASLLLEIHWAAPVDEEAIFSTISDDLETATGVMLKASNRQSGTTSGGAAYQQLTTMLPQNGFSVSRVNDEEWKAIGAFSVQFRLTQDVS